LQIARPARNQAPPHHRGSRALQRGARRVLRSTHRARSGAGELSTRQRLQLLSISSRPGLPTIMLDSHRRVGVRKSGSAVRERTRAPHGSSAIRLRRRSRR
jgi:hypothetical protein